MRDFQRQARLPDAAGSGQGDQTPRRISEPLTQDSHVRIATDEGRGGQRQRGCVRSLADRDVGRGASALHEGVARRTRQVERR
jgi:hypothetical protein